MEIITSSLLGKDYKKGKLTVSALKNISMHVENGEFISIIGKSGSGKSTLLNLIGGLDTPTSGELIVNEKALNKLSRKELSRHRKFMVGMIFQSFNLISSRTAQENVALALAFGGTPRKYRKQKAGELLAMVGLRDRINHKPTELSGGEAQRVAIARALANDPKIILADEPTGNLDSVTSCEIIDILVKLNRKLHKTIIMVTHDKDTAARISNRMILLKDGMLEQ
ncbi:MAG: ABC transporter ATP-binding protein [Bacteroidales bacterium]